MSDNHATTQTEMAICVVDYAKLTGSNTLNGFMGMNAVHVTNAGDCTFAEFRRMAYFERDLFFIFKLTPDIFCNEIKTLKIDDIAILILGVVPP